MGQKVIILIMVLMVLFTSSVAGAHTSSAQTGSETDGWVYRYGHLNSTYTDWRWGTSLSNYPNIRTGFENAASAWNSKQNNVRMGRFESRSNQMVNSEDLGTQYAGLFFEEGTKDSNGHHTHWRISINHYNYNNRTAYYYQMVSAHEIGHIWGLGDLYSTQWHGVAVMYGTTPAKHEPGTTDVIGITKIW